MTQLSAPFETEIVPIGDISAEEAALWNEWATPGGQLISPYLRYEFAAVIGRTRPDLRVARLHRGGELIGFFAHHAPRGGVMRPAGAPMSDYQGAVTRPGEVIAPGMLVKPCRGSALVFDNWYCERGGDPSARRSRDGSAICDLSAGGAAYLEAQRAQHRDHFKKSARRLRAAEREFGEARIEIGDPDGRAFQALLNWKQEQYVSTGKFNVMGVNWVRDALNLLRVRERCGDAFSGLTAALWLGDRLAAVEFGLKADGVYHSWFPAYDPALARYSPGLLLLHGLFEQAAAQRIERVDLGRGGAHYKKYYTSYEIGLDDGRALAPGLASATIQGWEAAEAAARILPGQLAALPGRARRRWSQISAFEPSLAPRLAAMAASFKPAQAA